jgi:hypothetical protein
MITKDGVDLDVCAYCNAPIDNLSRTVDHLYPKSRGGILSNKNKVPSCGDCNKLKADMNVVEFKRAISSMIFLEQTSHKKRISYLKKVKMNVEKIIERIKNDKKHFVRHSDAGSGKGGTKEEERP